MGSVKIIRLKEAIKDGVRYPISQLWAESSEAEKKVYLTGSPLFGNTDFSKLKNVGERYDKKGDELVKELVSIKKWADVPLYIQAIMSQQYEKNKP